MEVSFKFEWIVEAEGSAIDIGHTTKKQVPCLTISSTGRGIKVGYFLLHRLGRAGDDGVMFEIKFFHSMRSSHLVLWRQEETERLLHTYTHKYAQVCRRKRGLKSV
jgi:hypothetical protein